MRKQVLFGAALLALGTAVVCLEQHCSLWELR